MHSIIIPHRNYNTYLRHCLWSIAHSAEVCGRTDYEVVVVDQGSTAVPTSDDPHVKVIAGPPAPRAEDGNRYFNKPAAQNLGIRCSDGDVLSFIDADTLVGSWWLGCVDRLQRLGPMAISKLCYRVRYLPQQAMESLETESLADRSWRMTVWFAHYETFQRAREHYGEPDCDPNDVVGEDGCAHAWEGHVPPREPVFGNSQFSITRAVLGETRFNEEYAGRGFEDLWMNRELWRRDPENYRAAVVTDAEHALLQIRNPGQGALWGAGPQNKANFQRFYST